MPDPKLERIVQRMIDAGEPEENIATAIKGYAPPATDQGGDLLLENLKNIGGFIRSSVTNAAKHPVQAGALIGAGLAVPFTGGGSLAIPAAMVGPAAAALGGAGGAGLGMIGQAAFGDTSDLPATPGGVIKGMAKEGAIQGVTEGGGAVAQKGLQMAGRGLYRTAVRFPAKLTEKYGDLIGTGLRESAPVGSSRTIQGRMQASKASGDALVNDATQAGRTVPRSAMTDKYQPLVDEAARREQLGMAGDLDEIAAREMGINRANPAQMSPNAALDLRRSADSLAETAQNQARRGAPVNDMTGRLHNATRAGLNEGLDTATAGMTSREGLTFPQQSGRTKDLYGLSRGLRTAEQRPHALTNLASIGTGLASGGSVGAVTGDADTGAATGAMNAMLMRAMLSPAIQSRAGIASYAAGQLPAAQLIRAALLARLTSQSADTQPSPEEQAR